MRLQDVPITEAKQNVKMAHDSMEIQEVGEISFQLDQFDKYLYMLSDELSELEAVLGVVLREHYPEPGEEDGPEKGIESAMGARLYGMVSMLGAQVDCIQKLRQRVML